MRSHSSSYVCILELYQKRFLAKVEHGLLQYIVLIPSPPYHHHCITTSPLLTQPNKVFQQWACFILIWAWQWLWMFRIVSNDLRKSLYEVPMLKLVNNFKYKLNAKHLITWLNKDRDLDSLTYNRKFFPSQGKLCHIFPVHFHPLSRIESPGIYLSSQKI